MNKKCSCCGQKFFLEHSFFVGAIYVSYAIRVALFTSVIVAIKVLYPEDSTSTYVISIISAVVLLTPIIFRLSRSVWIQFFVKNDKDVECMDKS